MAANLLAITLALAHIVIPSRPAAAAVVKGAGFEAEVAGWRSWYGSYRLEPLGAAWCVDHGSRAPDGEYGYEPVALDDLAPDRQVAAAWLLAVHGSDDPVSAAAVMLVLHDLRGASYPTGVLDVDGLQEGDLRGFEGQEAEVLGRARAFKADAWARVASPIPHGLELTATAQAITVRALDAHGGALAGVEVELLAEGGSAAPAPAATPTAPTSSIAPAGAPAPAAPTGEQTDPAATPAQHPSDAPAGGAEEVTSPLPTTVRTGPDGTATVAGHLDPGSTVRATSWAPLGGLQAFGPTTALAQRVAVAPLAPLQATATVPVPPPTTVSPTTQPPTTVPPTTQTPTTQPPTTVAPTTQPPTTVVVTDTTPPTTPPPAVTVTVRAEAPRTLARTGQPTVPLSLVGLGALLAGSSLVWLARSSRQPGTAGRR